MLALRNGKQFVSFQSIHGIHRGRNKLATWYDNRRDLGRYRGILASKSFKIMVDSLDSMGSSWILKDVPDFVLDTYWVEHNQFFQLDNHTLAERPENKDGLGSDWDLCKCKDRNQGYKSTDFSILLLLFFIATSRNLLLLLHIAIASNILICIPDRNLLWHQTSLF